MRRVAELGRSPVWDHQIAPKDALHLATALDANLPLMNTFDRKLIRKCNRRDRPFGIKVETPRVDEPKLPLVAPQTRRS